MSNPAKAKGTRFESAVVDYLRDQGIYAERITLAGSHDRGDIRVGSWILETKNRKSYDVATALDEAKVEAANAGRPRYAAVVKRNGKGDPAHAFVIIDLEEFRELLREPVVFGQVQD